MVSGWLVAVLEDKGAVVSVCAGDVWADLGGRGVAGDGVGEDAVGDAGEPVQALSLEGAEVLRVRLQGWRRRRRRWSTSS